MDQAQVTLEVKKGMKIYQVVGAMLCIIAIGFLFYQMIQLQEYMDEQQALLFASIMSVFGLGALYSMIYSFHHRIVFDSEKMTRYGIRNSKEVYYSDMEEIRFSDSFWQLSATGKVLGNSQIYLIDYKYRDKEKAVSFLSEVLSDKDHPKVMVH